MDYLNLVYLFYVDHDDWTDDFVQTLVTKGKITQEQYDQAKADRQARIEQETEQEDQAAKQSDIEATNAQLEHTAT